MNKIFISSIIVGVAIMMVGAVLPAVAEPTIQPDEHRKGHESGIPLKYDPSSCTKKTNTCTVFIDSDRNGCDKRDKQIQMPINAIRNAGIPACDDGGDDGGGR